VLNTVVLLNIFVETFFLLSQMYLFVSFIILRSRLPINVLVFFVTRLTLTS